MRRADEPRSRFRRRMSEQPMSHKAGQRPMPTADESKADEPRSRRQSPMSHRGYC